MRAGDPSGGSRYRTMHQGEINPIPAREAAHVDSESDEEEEEDEEEVVQPRPPAPPPRQQFQPRPRTPQRGASRPSLSALRVVFASAVATVRRGGRDMIALNPSPKDPAAGGPAPGLDHPNH